MKLVANWKRSWRWLSMQAMALNVAGIGTWAALPPEMKDTIPQEWLTYAALGIAALGIVGRVVDQGEASKP